MKKSALIIIICLISVLTNAQNKSAYTWIFGNNGQVASFSGDTSRPTTRQLFWSGNSPNYPYIFSGGTSIICDSITGRLLLLCDGMVLYDTLGNIIDNGDHLVPNSIYNRNTYPGEASSQASIILPKGNNGEYYVFITTASDSMYATWLLPNATRTPNDLLLYNVVDMNANGGMGKVIKKNMPLITHAEMGRTNMQACRHANGVDWWLLKKSGYETNEITRFLVTKDSIYGPFKQNFSFPDFSNYDATGQMAFSKDGKKYASLQGKGTQLFMADFDRCSGELKNPKVFNMPIDSTHYLPFDSMGWRDSISGGGGFSPNGQFFYVSKFFNLYQFEFKELDSALAWVNIKAGADTTWNAFEYYNFLQLGVDGRFYIGKVAGGFKQLSVIDYPNLKGSACGFCRKCLRIDNGGGGSTAPPNVPDFNLGADVSMLPCAPLSNVEFLNLNDELVVYPNPASSKIVVRFQKSDVRKELYNSVGQMVLSTKEDDIDVSKLAKGMYYLRCKNEVKKVVIE
jgi:hypothetical protein